MDVTDPEWELDRQEIQILGTLGSGNYGEVFKVGHESASTAYDDHSLNPKTAGINRASTEIWMWQ